MFTETADVNMTDNGVNICGQMLQNISWLLSELIS